MAKHSRGKLIASAGFYTQSAAAKICGIHRATFNRLVTSGLIPEPSHRFEDSIRLYYKIDEILKIKKDL